MNSFSTLEVYYNGTWLEGQEGSCHAFPGRAARRHRYVLQFFVSAGYVRFPARNLKTRAADKLSKSKEVRVFLDVLDVNCGVGMSKANAPRDPNCVTNCESLICNHCTPPSDRFVHSVVIVGALGSHRRPSWKSKVGQVSEDCAQRRSNDGGICENEQRDESLQSAYGKRVINFGAGQIKIGRPFRLLNCAGAGTVKGDGGMHGELRIRIRLSGVPKRI